MHLKDYLPDVRIPSAAAAFITGISAAGLLALSLPPAFVRVCEGVLILCFTCIVFRLRRQRQQNLEMSLTEVRKISQRISSCLLILLCFLGFLQQSCALWPQRGAELPEGWEINGIGIVEESKALAANRYSGTRQQVTLRLISHEDSGYREADKRLIRLWKRQNKLLLTVCFDPGSEGEAQGAAFGQCCLSGARIRFSAGITPGEQPRNPGEFDYARYLRTKGIYVRADTDSRRVSMIKDAPVWQKQIADLRGGFHRQLEYYLSPKAGALISGCFLGDQTLLEREDIAIYQRAGISHLFSVSGTHGGILLAAALSLERFSFFQKKKWIARLISIGLLFAYLLFTGFPMSMLRTFLMACMTQSAALISRKGDTLNALSITAIVMLWFSPTSLFNAGFQLSFGVTYGLIHLCPWTKKWLPTVLALPVAAQLASMPMQAYWFYQVQPAGFLINLWAASLMPPLLLLSGLASLAGLAFPRLASILWQAPGLLAEALDKSANLWAAIPYASINVRQVSWPAYLLWGMALWILPGWTAREAAIGQWLYRRHELKTRREGWRQWQAWRSEKKTRMQEAQERAGNASEQQGTGDGSDMPAFRAPRSRADTALLLWRWRKPVSLACLLLCLACKVLIPAQLRITFLDVGQGDSAVFFTPSGSTWIVDAGSSNISSLGRYRLEPYLRSQGINRLDYLVVSHPDVDHISGVIDLLNAGWHAGSLVMASQAADKEEGRNLIRAARERGVRILIMSKGQELRDGEVTLRCLYPDADAEIADVNDMSLVAELRYRKFSLLLTGDISAEAEEKGMEGWPATSLLKVAHHGSKGSTGTAFLGCVQPVSAVVSCAKNNHYGHPHPDTLKRLKDAGVRVYLTMDAGAVQVSTNGRRFRIRSFISAAR